MLVIQNVHLIHVFIIMFINKKTDRQECGDN